MKKNLIVASLLSVLAMSSYSQTPVPAPENKDYFFQNTHPRREQVNQRLANQKNSIKDEVKEGDMPKSKAVAPHKKDQQIRQEERDTASQNGGHITKQEQKTLNQQENKASAQIGK